MCPYTCDIRDPDLQNNNNFATHSFLGQVKVVSFQGAHPMESITLRFSSYIVNVGSETWYKVNHGYELQGIFILYAIRAIQKPQRSTIHLCDGATQRSKPSSERLPVKYI